MAMFRILVLLVFALCSGRMAWAGEAVFSKNDVAINGYDAVAYHTERKPVAGTPAHVQEWRGVVWQFASAANRDAFAQEPQRYAPQYGGYCAFAASHGALAATDPHAWTLHDGKLYLNYSDAVRAKWRQNIDDHIARADRNWPRLQQQP